MSLLDPQLVAFMAIVEHKTVHAAAEAVHVTQTAVTQRIRALESKLATTLFLRTRRGMLVTPEGEALLHYCLAVRELEGEALAKIKGVVAEAKVQITIAGPTSIMQSRVVLQTVPVMKQYPNLLLRFDINDNATQQQNLRNGDCQLAILPKEDLTYSMDAKLLTAVEYVLVCTPACQHRKLKDIIRAERIIDFNAGDQTTLNYLRQYDLFDLACSERYFVNSTNALALLLSRGLGYSVLTKEFIAPFVKQKKLIILNKVRVYEHTSALVWYKRHGLPKYFSALIDVIN
jgi:LysR family transcriptional regulator (chromosome initiation inhibitor)